MALRAKETARQPRLSPTAKIGVIRPYDFSAGGDDSRFKCGSTNGDLYRIFMTGLDGAPMPGYGDTIEPADAWDLVHFLRVLQVRRHSKESAVLKASGGTIPSHVEKPSGVGVSGPAARTDASGGGSE